MRRCIVALAALGALAACDNTYDSVGPNNGPAAPTNLRYQLVPSGDPTAPQAITLFWDEPNDPSIQSYAVYSRGSTSEQWGLRATTTSPSFRDEGIPHLQYYVAATDGSGYESSPSNTITVDPANQLSRVQSLTSISLNHAVQLSWSANARQGNASLFDYYRVYSTTYDLDAGLCDDTRWVLEGTTVSEDFIASGLTNGSPRCFAVSAVSTDGHESVWSQPRADTPRVDARNVLVYSTVGELGESGFRFSYPGTGYGVVTSGDRTDIDFRVERHNDGSLWLVPVRTGTRLALYDTSPTTDLTSIDVAPARSQFSTGSIEAVPGYGYVVETSDAQGLHYGAVRITHVGSSYLILDWAYQTDPGNPELSRVRGH
jgi:hypothetical protein